MPSPYHEHIRVESIICGWYWQRISSGIYKIGFNMTPPAVNKTKIIIKKGTPIQLYMDHPFHTEPIGVALCTKSDTYTVDEVNYVTPGTMYVKAYDIPRTYNGKQYNRWIVWEHHLYSIKP
jgi:hypothetical protein